MKLVMTLFLTLALCACASKEIKNHAASAKSQPPLTRTTPLSGASSDLRKSTKFITLSQNIRFNIASTELSPSSRRALDEIANEIRKTEDSFHRIRIEGLTDPTGDADRNQLLSQRRADTVRNYLISRGVSEEKLEAIGKGPVNSNTMASAAQNARDRRVDFEIVE